jgi:hypothetical protein
MIGCVVLSLGFSLGSIGITGCTVERAMPNFGERCKDGLMLCICAGGETTGWIPCGADRMTTECGGCAVPPAGVIAGSASSTNAAIGVAGSASSPAAPSGAAGSFGGGASAPAAALPGSGCSAGEVCRQTLQGSMKFCSSDPAATFPPVCSAAGQPCGSNNQGVCTSGAPAGAPAALFCVYPSC